MAPDASKGLEMKTFVAEAVLVYVALASWALGGDQQYRIPTTSMEPTIKTDEVITATPLSGDATLARGDIVLYIMPANGKLSVKRVAGLPGDRVEMRAGQLFLNGAPVSEPYVVHTGGGAAAALAGDLVRQLNDMPAITVPPGTLFLLGDNRDESYDSRMAGPVRRDTVVARVKGKQACTRHHPTTH